LKQSAFPRYCINSTPDIWLNLFLLVL
jgi:hypothetical protein